MSDFVTGIEEYLLPYLISQLVSLLFILAAWKNTRLARALFSLMFLWASMTNLYTIFSTPDVYLDYAFFAIKPYREFINGWFSHNLLWLVPVIAIGQFIIGAGMLLENPWLKWACLGTILFLLAIAPLMVGAAFPFSITVSVAAWLVMKRDPGKFLWKLT